MNNNEIEVIVEDNGKENEIDIRKRKIYPISYYKIKNLTNKDVYYTARDYVPANGIAIMTGLLAEKAIKTGKCEIYNPKKEQKIEQEIEIKSDLESLKEEIEALKKEKSKLESDKPSDNKSSKKSKDKKTKE